MRKKTAVNIAKHAFRELAEGGAIERKQKLTFITQMEIDDYDNLTGALGKITALSHVMNDAFCSDNEQEPGDLLWLFIYLFKELDIVKAFVDSLKQVGKKKEAA